MKSGAMRATVHCTLMMVFVASPAVAQEWSAEAQAGRIRSSLDAAQTASTSAAVGLSYAAPGSALRLTGGIPVEQNDALWASVAGVHRFMSTRGNFEIGLETAANGYATRSSVEIQTDLPGPFDPPARNEHVTGVALAAQVAPLIRYERTRFQLQAQAGVSAFAHRFGDTRGERIVNLAEAELLLTPDPRVAVGPLLRTYGAREARYTQAGARLLASAGRVGMWTEATQWLSGESSALGYDVGINTRVHERVTFSIAARNATLDPLYATAPGASWHAGLSIKLGAAGPTAAPVPARYVDGRATIRLSGKAAHETPRIAGDFNGWKPQPMQRLASGEWSYTVSLKPGVYNYAFVDSSGDWFVPEKHPGRKQDGMGGYVAVLIVQ